MQKNTMQHMTEKLPEVPGREEQKYEEPILRRLRRNINFAFCI